MTKTHSPGPWRVAGDRITTPIRPIREMKLVAAEVSNPADAALIAASPEMLEMLKNAYSYMLVFNQQSGTIGEYELNLANSIKSVIAKAEGNVKTEAE